MFALFAALLAVAAIAFVLAPMWIGRLGGAGEPAEMLFYRAQLEEVDREKARGDLSGEEAESARAEAARRLLRLDASATAASSAVNGFWRRGVLAACVLLIGGAMALYVRVGAPALPDLPLAGRVEAVKDAGLATAIQRVERHLAQAPDDERGWEVLGPAYMQAERFDDAARAFREALRLKGPDARLSARLGEALISASNGRMTDEAVAAYQAVLQFNPADAEAQFYVALGAAQHGETEKAVALFTALEKAAPKDAPWLGAVRDQLATLQAKPGAANDAGPSAADPAASDQATQIEGMVKRLADRLAANGGSKDEWLRLIRAYVVLHRPEDALKALADARKAYGADTAALSEFDALAQELKIAPN